MVVDYYQRNPEDLLKTKLFKIANERKIGKESNIMKKKEVMWWKVPLNYFCFKSHFEINSTIHLSNVYHKLGIKRRIQEAILNSH